MSRHPDKLHLNTTLDLVTYTALAYLAAREDPAGSAANVPLRRIVREELDRLSPGLWDRLCAEARGLPAKLPARERVQRLLEGQGVK